MRRPISLCSRFAVIGLALAASSAAHPFDESRPSAERQRELTHLLRHDCGACHGLRLTGGLGPALDPDALRDKPAEGLAQTILRGRPGTAMPGWQPFLTEREAQWLVEALIHGLNSDEMQERNTKTRRHEEMQEQKLK